MMTSRKKFGRGAKMAYESTQVSPIRTWGDINALLYSHECSASRYTDEINKGFAVEFITKRTAVIEDKKVPRNHAVRIPVTFDFSQCNTKKQREQEIRTKWRSVFYWLKAQFDAIDKGIVLFEQVFLADTVLPLPGGRSIRLIDHVLPDLVGGKALKPPDFRMLLEE